MLNSVVTGYHSFPSGTDTSEKKRHQTNKLKLENNIQSAILRAYNHNNPQITHFYNNSGYNGVPLWALFEILTLGDFANLLSCLNLNTRSNITNDLNMQVAAIDTNRELIYMFLYIIKDLRNAVAHNAVVFDTRFRNFDPSKPMKNCLKLKYGFNYINFKTIGDYVILICYYLELLMVPKTQIKAFIRDFEKITDSYIKSVEPAVSQTVIHPDTKSRINTLKNFF